MTLLGELERFRSLFAVMAFSMALPARAGLGNAGEDMSRLAMNEAASDSATQQKSLYARLGPSPP